jgi:cell division protein ZapA (FtsZ GTPase activity inhibitor)
MSKVALKVVVAGRTYPLTVNESEVNKVNKAAEEINKAIKMLQENYAVKDMQDLLAMTALQLATRSGQAASSTNTADYSDIEEALKKLSEEI